MKKLMRVFTSKFFIVGLAVVLQLALILYLVLYLSLNFSFFYGISMTLSLILVVYIVNRYENPSFKLAWIILIIAGAPVGAIMYLLFGQKRVPKQLRTPSHNQIAFSDDILFNSRTNIERIRQEDPQLAKQCTYLHEHAFQPVYDKTQGTYFATGEAKYLAMIRALKEAEHFIFLEYFIIKDGMMWSTIREILEAKVRAGVAVYLIYDDFGCRDFDRYMLRDLRARGFHVVVFNPMQPKLAILMNNRDHRKICVIDNRIGFIGGINIADEYINVIDRFGYWKDVAVMIEGDAVDSLTLMFIQFYNYYAKEKLSPGDFRMPHAVEGQGYVIPFADAPTDNEDIGLNAHTNIITQAHDYVYIVTPYLIIGYEMIKALRMAAKNGVDVRLIVPHIPDKVMVNQVTKSNYQVLIEAGVRIYEYAPGFIHAKTMVADDEVALIGTANMDYRSYYMHFECGILFIGSPVVLRCRDDFLRTIGQSVEITAEDCASVPMALRVLRAVLNLFGGVM